MNLEQAKELLFLTHLAAIDTGERAYGRVLQSGPGIGKTEAQDQYVERLCLHLNEPIGLVVEMLANHASSGDTRGFMIPMRGEKGELPKTVFSIPTWYPSQQSMRVCEPDGKGGVIWHAKGTWTGPVPEIGVLFLDEWGQADEDVRKAAAPLIHQGWVGDTALPPLWRVVAAQNRPSDRSGVQRELMHVVNRRFLMEIEPDLATWLNWADDQPVDRRPHHLTRSFARKEPGIVFRATLPDSTDPYCTPRALCMLDRDIRVLRTQEDIDHDRLPMGELAREDAGGIIGKGAAAQFFTHLRFADELPDLPDIFADPMKAKLPSGKDAQMVATYMLADAISEDNAKNAFRYILRCNREMQTLAVNTITGGKGDAAKSAAQVRRAKALVILPEYRKWIDENADTLMAAQM